MNSRGRALVSFNINNLLGVVAETLEQYAKGSDDVAADFAMLAAHARATPVDGVHAEPMGLPVCRHWEEAMKLAGAGAAADVASALDPIAASLVWIQNPNYTVEAMGRAFVDNFGYADLVGPRGLVPGGAIAVGVLLLGPHTTYPPHAHPALEVYCVLGGAAEWRRGDSPWSVRPAGSLIHHPPGIAHATRTGAEPMLALYLWHGYLNTPAALTEQAEQAGRGPSAAGRREGVQ